MKEKIIKYIRKPSKIILYLMNKGYLNFINDETYLKMKYYLIIKKRLDLKEPKTFNEKLQWLKLYDRNPEYTKMVDKYEAKKYVSNLIGEECIIPRSPAEKTCRSGGETTLPFCPCGKSPTREFCSVGAVWWTRRGTMSPCPALKTGLCGTIPWKTRCTGTKKWCTADIW